VFALAVKLCRKSRRLLREIFCGAHVQVHYDRVPVNQRGWYYKLFKELVDAYPRCAPRFCWRWPVVAHEQRGGRRRSSHTSSNTQYGLPAGELLQTLLLGEIESSDVQLWVRRQPTLASPGCAAHTVGLAQGPDSWFQLEGAEWDPLHHPVRSLVHIINYFEYKATGRQIGPLCTSRHTDAYPIVMRFRA
jgi:hypothetical protein